MRVGIYTRVSQARDAKKGLSVGQQERECRDDITDNVPGAIVVDPVYCDDDRGASRYSRKMRPEWDRLMTDLRAGQLDMLCTWESSRAQRDLEVYVELRKICRDAGVLWRYDGHTYDLSDDDDAYRTGQDALDAERESGKTRKRVRRAVRSRAAAGKPHGKLLYGYAREYDPKTKVYLRTIIDPVTGPIMEEIYRRYADGEGITAIATDLTKRGVPTPQGAPVWRGSTTGNLIRNRGHLGHRVSTVGHPTTEDAWPALIDEATWYRVKARLDDPTRPVRQDSTVKHLLSGIALCGVCGGRLVHNGGRSSKTSRTYPTYICHDRRCVGRSATGMEHDVLGFVFGMWEDDDRVSQTAGDDPRLVELENEHAALVAELTMWQDSPGTEGVTPISVAAAERRLIPQIDELAQQLKALRARRILPDVDGPLHALWPDLTLSKQREIIAASVSIVVLPVGQGKRYDSASVTITPRW